MGSRPSAPLFAPRAKEAHATNFAAWGVAAAVILLALGGLLLLTHHKPAAANVILPLDPYAPNLVFSDVQMSESSSVSGMKVTFVDGTVRNTGSRTISGIDLQVIFANDLQMPPQIEPVPLNLIRTHEPYIDTEPVSAVPLAPGDSREFRLAFENISQDWNQSLPAIRVVKVATK